MRRIDREVTSKEEILDILERCQTVRIAMHGGEYPYVVPVSFGLVREGEQPVLYFHCAKQGLKCGYLAENGRVCGGGQLFQDPERQGRHHNPV